MTLIRISCLGDLLPSDTAYTLGRGIGSRTAILIDHYEKPENRLFQDSDIVFCNLEAPLISEVEFRSLPFTGNPEIIRLLRALNISIVSIANNHIPEHGPEGIDNTIILLKNNSIIPVGHTKDNIPATAYLNIKGIKVAFAAFTCIHHKNENNRLAPADKDLMLSTLEQIKKQTTDLIIFSIHWGDEYITYPSPEQVELAHKIIDSGVNVIIGHHPHVIQPVESYNGGVILYSLGNFMFDMFWSDKVRYGMQVDLLINSAIKLDYQVKPFRINRDFTHDYSNGQKSLSILSKAESKFRILETEEPEVFRAFYMKNSRIIKRQARIMMKLHIIMDIVNFNRQSLCLLMKNVKSKSSSKWKKA
jgi:gamma-polyglutamate biosynthesis protein CapA